MDISFVITLILQCAFFFSDKTDNALDVVHTRFQDLRSRFASRYEDVYDSVWTSARHSTYRVFGPPPLPVIVIEVIKGETVEELRDRLQNTKIDIRIIELPEEYSPAPDSPKVHATTIDDPPLPEPSSIGAPPPEASSIDATPPQAPAGDASTGKRLPYLLPYICLSVTLAVQVLVFRFGYLNDPSRRESSRTTANGTEHRSSRSRRRKYSTGSDTQADSVVDGDEFARQFLTLMRQWGPSLSTKLQDYNKHASISPDVVAMYAAPSQHHTNVATRDNKAYQTEYSSPNPVLSSRGQEDWRSKTVFDEAFGVPAVPPSYMSAAGSAEELDDNGTSPSPKATGSGLVPRRLIDTPKPPRVRFGINLFYIQDGSESQESPAKTTVSPSHTTYARDGDVFAKNSGGKISKVIDAKIEDETPEESEQLLESPFAVHPSRVGPDSSWQNETPRPLRIQRDVFYTIPKKAMEIQPRESRRGTGAQDTVQSDRGILDPHADSTRQASHDGAPVLRILSRPSLLRTPERVYLLESPLVSKNYSAFPSMLGQEPRTESVLVPRLQGTEKRRGGEDDRDAVHDVYSSSANSRRQHMDENDDRQRDSDEHLLVKPFSRDHSRPRTSRNGQTDTLQRVSHERPQEEPDLLKTLRPRSSHNRRTDKAEDTQRVPLPIDERRNVEIARRDRHHEASTVYSMGPGREPAHGVFRTSKRHSRSSPVKSHEPEPEPSCRCPGGDPFCYERASMEWFHSTPIRSHCHDTLCRDMKKTQTVKRIERKWLKSDTGLYQSSHFMRDGRLRSKFV